MSIHAFTRLRWRSGERDADEVASEYIREALASDDPEAALRPAVRELVNAAFAQLRSRAEDRVLQPETTHPEIILRPAPWQQPARPRTWGQTRWRRSTSRHEDWMALLETEVWTAGRGMIPWAEVTTEDIFETIGAYEQQIEGVGRRITKLETARKLMADHGVSVFGKIPLDEQHRVIAMPG